TTAAAKRVPKTRDHFWLEFHFSKLRNRFMNKGLACLYPISFFRIQKKSFLQLFKPTTDSIFQILRPFGIIKNPIGLLILAGLRPLGLFPFFYFRQTPTPFEKPFPP